MSIPGSLVLGGWDIPEYGRLCDPSTPPTFDALPGINREHLPGFINSLLNLRAGSSTDGRYFVNPEIMGSGQLRPLAVAMAATIVMYYEHAYTNSLAALVTTRQRTVMIKHGFATHQNVHDIAILWSQGMKAKFKADNAGLLRRETSDGAVQVTAAIAGLSNTLTLFQRSIDSNFEAISSRLKNQETSLASHSAQIKHLSNLFSSRAQTAIAWKSPSLRRGDGT